MTEGRVPAFVEAALTGNKLPIFGDGLQTRSLCYVDDLIDGIVRLLISDYVGPVNLGNPTEVTILEVAEMIQDIVGSHPGLEFQPLPQDDPTVRCPDTRLAEKELDWRADDFAAGRTRTDCRLVSRAGELNRLPSRWWAH